jgi:hypothetical protein
LPERKVLKKRRRDGGVFQNWPKTWSQSNVAFMLAVLSTVVAPGARADVVEAVDLTFQSGATFTGTVDLSDDYSIVTGVDGVLAGGPYTTQDIGWVWDLGVNRSTATDVFSTFLMSGTPGPATPNVDGATFDDFVGFSYNYALASNITLSGIGTGNTVCDGGKAPNCIDFTDLMVSGSIRAVPEPTSITLFLTTLLAVAFVVRKRIALR